MSTPPPISAPLRDANATSPALPPSRPGSPVGGFLLDVVMGVGILLVLSLASSLVWGMWRGVEVVREAKQNGLPMPAGEALVSAMGAPGALAQMLIALVATGGAALALYFLRRRASAAERSQSLQAIRRASTWGWIVLVASCVFAGTSGASLLAKQLGIEPEPTNLHLMQQAWAGYPVFLLLFAVVLAPAYEELLFRRVLFGRLWAAGKPWLGIVLSSAAFALVHEIPGTSPNGLPEMLQLWLVYGGMGAAFAWVYRKTGTLWAAIAAHAINNAIALAALILFGMQ